MNLTTLIVVGPVASGKSTHIEERYKSLKGVWHLSWDAIREKIYDEVCERVNPANDIEKSIAVTYSIDRARTEFSLQLDGRLATKHPVVLVDRPLYPNSDWATEVITKSRAAKYDIVVEGIWTDPEIALRRRLQDLMLNKLTINDNAEFAAVIDVYKKIHFREFPVTYQAMSRKFMNLVADARLARLYDNSAEGRRPKLVAVWENGRLQGEFAPAAKNAFEQLGSINPDTADFSASCNFSRNAEDDLIRTLHIETKGFYDVPCHPS